MRIKELTGEVIYRVQVVLSERFDEGNEVVRTVWLEGQNDTEDYKENIIKVLTNKYQGWYYIEEITITGLAFSDSDTFYSLEEKIK